MLLAILFFVLWLLGLIFWVKASSGDPSIPILVMGAIACLGWAVFGPLIKG